jgi:ketosteroid isomerase-like protein
MKSIRVAGFVLFALISASMSGSSAEAQDKEREKPGTTVDSWRQSLPPEAETYKPTADMPAVTESSPSNSEAQRTVLSLERMWMESLKVVDADTLSQLVSSDFTFVSPRMPKAKDRTNYLEHALRDLKLTSYEFTQVSVRFFGRTAIVSGLLTQKATVRGEDWDGDYVVTDVWISRDGVWRAVSRHESPLAKKKQ